MSRRRRIVLFTGAGASKVFQFPLTGDILPEIRRRLKKKTLFGRGKKARILRKKLLVFFCCIFPGFEAVLCKDLPLITEVLSLVDHSLLMGIALCPEIQRRELQNIRRLLERAIYLVLDWDIDYDEKPKLLGHFTDSILRMRKKALVGIISTNYDPLIEMEMFNKIKTYTEIINAFDFGCEWRDDVRGKIYHRPINPAIAVYKLHGSLNMLKCPHCEHFYINLDGDISFLDYEGGNGARNDGWNQCHCEYAPLEACMIAPSSVRDIRDPNLLEIWRNALEFLRKADDWIIIGYSFPMEDIGIRSMFCRAFQGRRKKPRVIIVQLGKDAKTIARYRLMFPKCKYEEEGMEAFAEQFGQGKRKYEKYIRSLPSVERIAETPALVK